MPTPAPCLHGSDRGPERIQMTRFNELRRIQRAIEHKDKADLRWALKYCAMRLRLATRKHHTSHWRKIAKQVRAGLDEP